MERIDLPKRAVAVIRLFCKGCDYAMDTRYVFSALIGAFCLFLIFAVITTARYLAQREVGGSLKAKQGRQAEYVRLTAVPRV